MPDNLYDEKQELTPTEFPNKTLTAIGRLIRSFAEIEDLLNLFIGTLSALNESRTLVLLGQISISRRVEMARYLAQMAGGEIAKIHGEVFNGDFTAALKCRDCAAHSFLAGKSIDKGYAFITTETHAPDDESSIHAVAFYTHEEIKHHAILAEKAASQLEERLKLNRKRVERLSRPLLALSEGPNTVHA